jgi:hypothetical protein
VPGGGTFPKLDITISLHGLFCLDSAFVVLAAGRHTRAWDGRDAGGVSVRAGVYFLRLAIDGSVRWRSIAKLE